MAKKKTKASKRVSWLDAKTKAPLLDDYAQKLDSFIKTMADGKVDEAEIKAQEKRMTKLMKEIEPKLNDSMHAKVTELLCELTACNLMRTLFLMEQARPKTTFRG